MISLQLYRKARYRIDISIDLDDIQQRIYTEGEWHPADNATAYGVTSANSAIIDRRVTEAVNDLLTRLGGYLMGHNVNLNLDSENIVLAIGLATRPAPTLQEQMKEAIVTAIANYVLMSLYGDEESIYGTAWRLWRSRVMLLLARASR